MAAGTHNITIEKKASFSFSATFKQPNGSALNLTDRTPSAQIRRDFDNGLQATFTVVKTDATNGIATLSLTSAQTSALTEDPSHYDLFFTLSNGTVEKVLQGSVSIIKNVTT